MLIYLSNVQAALTSVNTTLDVTQHLLLIKSSVADTKQYKVPCIHSYQVNISMFALRAASEGHRDQGKQLLHQN